MYNQAVLKMFYFQSQKLLLSYLSTIGVSSPLNDPLGSFTHLIHPFSCVQHVGLFWVHRLNDCLFDPEFSLHWGVKLSPCQHRGSSSVLSCGFVSFRFDMCWDPLHSTEAAFSLTHLWCCYDELCYTLVLWFTELG